MKDERMQNKASLRGDLYVLGHLEKKYDSHCSHQV